jgi:hypothetical protein
MLGCSANVGRWWEEISVCVHLEQQPGVEESFAYGFYFFLPFYQAPSALTTMSLMGTMITDNGHAVSQDLVIQELQ